MFISSSLYPLTTRLWYGCDAAMPLRRMHNGNASVSSATTTIRIISLKTTRKRKIREEKRPACDACRAQKLKCDAFLDYSRPCSRCFRKQAECVVLEERRKKTPSTSHKSQTTSISPQSHAYLASQSPESGRTSDRLPMELYSAPSALAPVSNMSSKSPGLAFPTSSVGGTVVGTKPRVLEHIHVDAPIIDVCFAR